MQARLQIDVGGLKRQPVIRFGLCNHFATLPESLSNLTALKVLDLDSILLSTLPDWVGQLPVLEQLSIDENDFTSLPAWLHGYQPLVESIDTLEQEVKKTKSGWFRELIIYGGLVVAFLLVVVFFQWLTRTMNIV